MSDLLGILWQFLTFRCWSDLTTRHERVLYVVAVLWTWCWIVGLCTLTVAIVRRIGDLHP